MHDEDEKWVYVIGWLCAAAGLAFGLILAALLAGCTFDVDVDHRFPDGLPEARVEVDVGQSAVCATCLPVCRLVDTAASLADGGAASGAQYGCAPTGSGSCEACEPGCLGARWRMCGPGGPACWNDGPAGPVRVPVLCVPRADGGL